MDAFKQIQVVPNPWADLNVSGIGRLVAWTATAGWTGTAELIEAEYVLTAAHCLVNAVGGQVTFGADPDQNATENQKRTYAFRSICVCAKYLQGDQTWDVGVARLDRPVQDKEIGVLKVRQPGGMGWVGLGKSQIQMLGYAAATQGVTASEAPAIKVGPMYCQQGTPYAHDAQTNMASYQFDTRGGHSGGPVMLVGSNEVIGVHSEWDVMDGKQVGKAVLLTDPVQQWVKQAKALLAVSPHFQNTL